jgi:hypothetical protein
MAEGNSYQKYDGASGSYQEIPNPNGTNGSSPPRSSRTKWILGAVLVAVVGVVYTVVSTAGPSADVVDKALAKSGIQVKADGKIKLFDEFSK